MPSNILSDQVALVTGASRGIGAAIADRLAADGARVVGTATSEQGAAAIEHRLGAFEPAGTGRVLDVTHPQAVESLIKAVTKEFGSPGIVVNNAGITRDTLMMRMKEEDWQGVLDTNLSGAFRVAKAAIKGMMKARSGRIINVGSVVGLTGNAGQVNYSAAKAGLAGLTRSMAREVGARGITVNTVAPGFIETDMTRELSQETRDAMLAQIPLGQLGKVDDIADAVAFLASPSAGYITGETLNINGGLYMGA